MTNYSVYLPTEFQRSEETGDVYNYKKVSSSTGLTGSAVIIDNCVPNIRKGVNNGTRRGNYIDVEYFSGSFLITRKPSLSLLTSDLRGDLNYRFLIIQMAFSNGKPPLLDDIFSEAPDVDIQSPLRDYSNAIVLYENVGVVKERTIYVPPTYAMTIAQTTVPPWTITAGEGFSLGSTSGGGTLTQSASGYYSNLPSNSYQFFSFPVKDYKITYEITDREPITFQEVLHNNIIYVLLTDQNTTSYFDIKVVSNIYYT